MVTVHETAPGVPSRPPVTGAEARAFIAYSDYLDRLHGRALEAERAGYERGRRDGWRQGYEAGYAASEAGWREMFRPAQRAARATARATSRELLEWRRWGKGGRARFGDPRPGDYQGAGR